MFGDVLNISVNISENYGLSGYTWPFHVRAGGVAGCNIKSGQILVIDQKDLLLC